MIGFPRREYPEKPLGAKIVLVDGAALTRLMIKHNLGVAAEHVYEIKRLDTDFLRKDCDLFIP